MVLGKKDLIEKVASQSGLSKIGVEKALNTLTDVITDEVAKGNSVAMVGFGTFKAQERSARSGINPKTKEKISIPATKLPKFSAGKKFKDAVKNA